jgi:hypothetical protein
MPDPPTDSLADILTEALSLLEEGAGDPASVWHTPTLATTGVDGTARLRTIVLRGWNSPARCAEIHTDLRSAKCAELRRAPQAGLHGWDATRRIQLRLAGRVRLHAGDAIAEQAWAGLRPASRSTYRVLPGPGAGLADPDGIAQTTEAEGFAAFCVLHLTCDTLEWLQLRQGSHRRALFRWAGEDCTPMWLVP